MKNKFTAIVLAAGKGTRMKSSLAKVLHPLREKPLLIHVLNQLLSLTQQINEIIVILGFQGETVEKTLNQYFPANKKIKCVYQKQLTGTASAVQCAKNYVTEENTLILCGDAPLIKYSTLKEFINYFLRTKKVGAFISAKCNQENSLGRVLRDEKGQVSRICEKDELLKNMDSLHHYPHEVNSGIYAFQTKSLFDLLKKIKENPRKKEFYLTDIVKFCIQEQKSLNAFYIEDSNQVLGINSQKELLSAERLLQLREIDLLIDKGVKVYSPETTYLETGVKIGKNTKIYPFTYIGKDVIIGSNCTLGPFIHIRGGSKVEDDTYLGNFLEINRSHLGKKVQMKHFGYLGDTVVAESVNIGAGTVTANFDGHQKNITKIGKNAFIGSDTIIVAPVTIGEGSVTGAGSVVNRNVENEEVVVGVPAKYLRKRKWRKSK